MIRFSIQLQYKSQKITADVHELYSHPKHWHVSVLSDDVPAALRGTYLVTYDYEMKKYQWGFNHSDHAFINAVGEALEQYLQEYGWDSVSK